MPEVTSNQPSTRPSIAELHWERALGVILDMAESAVEALTNFEEGEDEQETIGFFKDWAKDREIELRAVHDVYKRFTEWDGVRPLEEVVAEINRSSEALQQELDGTLLTV